MKKIILKKKKLNEDDQLNIQQPVQQQPSDSQKPEGIQIKYNDSDNPQRAKEFTDMVSQTYAREIARDTHIVNIKMTKSFQDDVKFPTAATGLASLFMPAQMPKKFTNVYSSYDADPLKTIAACEDYAAKFFANLQKEQKEETPKEVKDGEGEADDKAIEQANKPEEQETPPPPPPVPNQEQPQGEQQPQNPEGENTSESGFENWREIYNSVNEDTASMMAGAATGGFKAGQAVSAGGGIAASGLTGFLAGVLPLAGGVYGVGYAAGSTSFSKGIVDDRELKKQYSQFRQDSQSMQKNIGSAIDSYVKTVMGLYAQALKHITSGSKVNEINKLNKMVINLLVSRAPEYVNEFVKENNSMLKDIMSLKAKETELKWRTQREFMQNISKMMKDPKFQELKVHPAAIAAYMDSGGKRVSAEHRDSFEKISSYMAAHSRNGDEYSDALENTNYIKYRKELALCEAELADKPAPQFDADAMFDNIESSIESAVSDILASSSEEWGLVKTARKQMEAMRDAASQEIKTSIEHVCRMANGENSGLSARLTGFISKHPLRAAKLTNLWARHETDLNYRIEQRLKQISELDGKGPLMMANELYTVVMPKLLAMMITYKVILNFYTDERLKIPNTVLGNAVDPQRVSQMIDDYKQTYANLIAEACASGCSKLTDDGSKPFDMQSGFNGTKMPYLAPWLMNLLDQNGKTISAENMNGIKQIVNVLEEAADKKDHDSFFSKLSDYIISECGSQTSEHAAGIVYDSLDKFNAEEFKEFVDDFQKPETAEQYQKIENQSHAVYLLMYAMKSQGGIFGAYKQNYAALSGYIGKDIAKDQQTRAQIMSLLEIEDNKDDDVYAAAEKLFYNAVPHMGVISKNGNVDIVLAMQAYYALGLNKTDGYVAFPLSKLKIFKDMCYNQVIKEIFASDAAVEEYLSIQRMFQDKTSSVDAFNKYVEHLGKDMDKTIGKFKLEDYGITNNDQFNARLATVLNAMDDNKTPSAAFMTQEFMDAIGWEFQEKTLDDIMPVIFPKAKVKPKTVRELVSYPEEHIRKFDIIPTATKYIKGVLLMEIAAAFKTIEGSRNVEQELKDVYATETIPFGTTGKKVPFKNISSSCITIYDMAGKTVKNKVKQIVQNMDNGYVQLLNQNVKVNMKPGIFSEYLCKMDAVFKDGTAFAEYIENFIHNNVQNITPDQEKECITSLCHYLINPDKYKAVDSLYKLCNWQEQQQQLQQENQRRAAEKPEGKPEGKPTGSSTKPNTESK